MACGAPLAMTARAVTSARHVVVPRAPCRGPERAATSSCSPGTCTLARSCSRIPAAAPAAHLRARLAEGLYREGDVTLHVSTGLGTTFVPFRFFVRPEATELVLTSRR